MCFGPTNSTHSSFINQLINSFFNKSKVVPFFFSFNSNKNQESWSGKKRLTFLGVEWFRGEGWSPAITHLFNKEKKSTNPINCWRAAGRNWWIVVLIKEREREEEATNQSSINQTLISWMKLKMIDELIEGGVSFIFSIGIHLICFIDFINPQLKFISFQRFISLTN